MSNKTRRRLKRAAKARRAAASEVKSENRQIAGTYTATGLYRNKIEDYSRTLSRRLKKMHTVCCSTSFFRAAQNKEWCAHRHEETTKKAWSH